MRMCMQPIGPAPKTTTRVAGLDAEQLLGVDGAGERLGGRRLVVPHVVGDPVEAVDLEHLLRHDHVLGEPAVVLVADRGLVLADRHPALLALVAVAARHGRDHLGAVADLPVAAVRRLDVRADLDHLAGDLVADGARRAEVLVAVVEDLDVGAAGRAVLHLELDLVGTALGFGDVLDADVFGGIEAKGLHEGDATARDGKKATQTGINLCPNAWQRARFGAECRCIEP